MSSEIFTRMKNRTRKNLRFSKYPNLWSMTHQMFRSDWRDVDFPFEIVKSRTGTQKKNFKKAWKRRRIERKKMTSRVIARSWRVLWSLKFFLNSVAFDDFEWTRSFAKNNSHSEWTNERGRASSFPRYVIRLLARLRARFVGVRKSAGPTADWHGYGHYNSSER